MTRGDTGAKPGPLSRFRPSGEAAAVAPAQLDEGEHIGEVVESSTTQIVAQARLLHEAPSFGSFVRVGSATPALGIVYDISTQSLEPHRRPTAYGKTESQLRREQPQIFQLLRTHFQILVLGYMEGGDAIHILPPQPARIHSFTHVCDEGEVRACTQSDEFLRAILNSTGTATDDLLIAALRHAVAARHGDRGYLVSRGKDLSRLLRDDYDRLSSVVRRIPVRGGDLG